MIGKTQFLAVLGILALGGGAWSIEVNEPVGHWKFDESSGATALDCVGDNNGTLVNGPIWTTGKIVGALSFDGIDDYVDMVYPGPLGNSPRTITAWAKTSSRATQIFFSYGGTSGRPGSTIRAGFSAFGCEGATLDISYGVVTYSATVADGQWHHYAYVVPDKVNAAIGDVELYQDGVLLTDLCASIHSSIINTSPNHAIDIGRYTSDQTRYFHGIIDDVRIYDKALPAEEIREIYLDALSSYERAIIQIEDAVAEKEEMLEGIDEALEKEADTYDALEELLEGGDYGDLKKGDIVKAQQKVYSAMQHQEQSADALEKSIEKLYDALTALGWKPPADDPVEE